jgi:hypothetical protein
MVGIDQLPVSLTVTRGVDTTRETRINYQP